MGFCGERRPSPSVRGNSFSAQTQWFIQGGLEDTGDKASHYDGETVMAAGFQTGLRKNISLTEGISLAHEAGTVKPD